MPGMALGTTTIENIVAHDAAALEKDLASIRTDAGVQLPGVPQIVTRLQQMLSDPEVGIPQLVPVINYEPVLVGRVLQMANSAALNPTRRQITDLRTGVTRVGFDLLRSAALAYALRQVSQAHSVKDVRAHLEALWERSAWTADISPRDSPFSSSFSAASIWAGSSSIHSPRTRTRGTLRLASARAFGTRVGAAPEVSLLSSERALPLCVRANCDPP